MSLSEAQLAKMKDIIVRGTDYAKSGADPVRYGIMRRFGIPYKTILSVGSGGYEPVIINATHALDTLPLAGKLLKENRWKGKYYTGSCTELPFKDKEFDCGICTEVIEHLDTMEEVDKTFFEIDRVCKNWIVSTPAIKVPEPTHKRVFTAEQMHAYAAMYFARAVKAGIWWFVLRCDRGFAFAGDKVGPKPQVLYSYGIPRGMTHA